MRPVKIKKWIPAEYPEGTDSATQDRPGHYVKSGTGQYTPEFTEEALFHEWTIGTFPIEGAMGNVVEAIIELPDGTISVVSYRDLKFVPETLKHVKQQKIFENEAYSRWFRIQHIIDSSEKAAALLEYGKWYDTEYKKIILELLDDENKS